jgi:formate hydrogenlyase transcriptional activator
MKDEGGRMNPNEQVHPSSLIPHPSEAGVTLADAEREHILGVLRETGWVLGGPNGAAARLAMKRTTLQSKMGSSD